jgi:hypothetical protein
VNGHFITKYGLECVAKDCIFQKECAQHETAGDFRCEDGFSPELVFDIHTNTVICKTKDEDVHEIPHYATIPQNYEKLDRGILTFDQISKNTSPEFHI